MGTPNILVGGSQAVSVLQNNHAGVVISNEGSETCYLDDQSSVSPASNDYTLRPGDRISWLENVPCWAITNPLLSTEIGVSQNVNQFSASILGSSRLYATVGSVTGGPAISSVTVDGIVGTLYDYAVGTGGITFATQGLIRACLIGGGSYDNGPNYGNCGLVFDGWVNVNAATYALTIGNYGLAGVDGGGSSIGSVVSAPGGFRAVWPVGSTGAGRGFVGAALTDGYPSSITGATITYGQFNLTTYGSKNGRETANAGRIFIFIPS